MLFVSFQSPHLHNFFAVCEKWDGSGTNALDIIQNVKVSHLQFVKPGMVQGPMH